MTEHLREVKNPAKFVALSAVIAYLGAPIKDCEMDRRTQLSSTFHEEFKRLRNQLRTIEPLSLIGEASIKLRELELLPPQKWDGWVAWDLLLLIRWGVIHGGQNRPLKRVDRHKLIKLVNLAKEVGSYNPFLHKPAQFAVAKTFRTMAFQQFWFQHALARAEIGREGFLVDQLPDDGPVKKAVYATLGIGAQEFHEMLLMLILFLRGKPAALLFGPRVFENTNYEYTTVDAFLKSISVDFAGLKDAMARPTVRTPILQVLDRTPLIRYPLLRLPGERYHVYSNRVLEETYRTLLHDVARDSAGSEAAEELGAAVAKHVERALNASRVTFLRESELKARFGESKVTDFAVVESDCTVLVEAKAGDVRSTVKVFPEKRQLINELQDSVLKAIHQGLALAQRIKQQDPSRVVFADPLYLLVVTHRETYIGSMVEAWEEFVREGLEARLKKDGITLDVIGPNHIFVLSVADMDELARVLGNSDQTIGQILSKAATTDADPATRKYIFGMHLTGLAPNDARIEYLHAEGERLLDRVERRFRT